MEFPPDMTPVWRQYIEGLEAANAALSAQRDGLIVTVVVSVVILMVVWWLLARRVKPYIELPEPTPIDREPMGLHKLINQLLRSGQSIETDLVNGIYCVNDAVIISTNWMPRDAFKHLDKLEEDAARIRAIVKDLRHGSGMALRIDTDIATGLRSVERMTGLQTSNLLDRLNLAENRD